MLRRRLLTLAFLPLMLAAPAGRAQVQVEGHRYEAQAHVGGRDLRLNGVGVRAVAWLKGYTAGLYLEDRATSAEAAIAMVGAKRLRLRLLQDVPAQEFVKAIDKGFARNTPAAEQASLSERRAAFDRQVQALGKVRKDTIVDLDLEPGGIFTMRVDGRPGAAPIAGEDFYAALLRIFLGEHPVDPDLKAGLLGRRPPA